MSADAGGIRAAVPATACACECQCCACCVEVEALAASLRRCVQSETKAFADATGVQVLWGTPEHPATVR